MTSRGTSTGHPKIVVLLLTLAVAASMALIPLLTASSASATTATHPHTTPTQGYWLTASDGGIFSYGTASFHGSTGAISLNKPIVGMASTPDGKGYWLVASDGGIFSFGDAAFHGSTGAITLNKPIVGMAATPDGLGYWLVASDGGIFSFGDAKFYGSAGALPLNKPIVGMASTSDGQGYWLVASDGGIFSYGDATFHGSTGAITLNKPIVGMTSTPNSKGYWLVASDGGIFNYGDAKFYGSAGAITLNKPIVALAATDDGQGYWLVASDGGIFSYGDATFEGSTGGMSLNKPIVGMAVVPHPAGVEIDPGHGITGISCVLPTWCMAVDTAGDAINYLDGVWLSPQFINTPENSSLNPALSGISCTSTSFCMAVGNQTGYTFYTDGRWTTPTFSSNYPGQGFSGVSCATTDYCGLTASTGATFLSTGTISKKGTSLHGAHGSTPMSCLSLGLYSVGSSPDRCMQVDDQTDFANSLGPTSWPNGVTLDAAAKLAGAAGLSVSCWDLFETSGLTCKAVFSGSGIAETFSGNAWSSDGAVDTGTAVPNLVAVSCKQTKTGFQLQCAAVDYEGNVLYSNNQAWTTPAPFDVTGIPSAVSCPTNAFCMAVDQSGFAYPLVPAPPI